MTSHTPLLIWDLTDTKLISLYAVPVLAACLLGQCTAEISGCALYCLTSYAAAALPLLTI